MKVRELPLNKINSPKGGLEPISNLETVQEREKISLLPNQLTKKIRSQLNAAAIWCKTPVQLVQKQNL